MRWWISAANVCILSILFHLITSRRKTRLVWKPLNFIFQVIIVARGEGLQLGERRREKSARLSRQPESEKPPRAIWPKICSIGTDRLCRLCWDGPMAEQGRARVIITRKIFEFPSTSSIELHRDTQINFFTDWGHVFLDFPVPSHSNWQWHEPLSYLHSRIIACQNRTAELGPLFPLKKRTVRTWTFCPTGCLLSFSP